MESVRHWVIYSSFPDVTILQTSHELITTLYWRIQCDILLVHVQWVGSQWQSSKLYLVLNMYKSNNDNRASLLSGLTNAGKIRRYIPCGVCLPARYQTPRARDHIKHWSENRRECLIFVERSRQPIKVENVYAYIGGPIRGCTGF